MGESRRRNIPLPSSDHEAEAEAAEDCGSESTRKDTVESGITVDSSRGFSSHNADARLDQSAGWTDEKHNSYLGYLEASFVKKLHRSIRLRGWQSQGKIWGPFSSLELPANTNNSSDQFAVLRDGCWQKVNFGKNEPLLDRTADSHVVLESQWILHFTSASKHHTATPPASRESVVSGEGIYISKNMTFSCGSAGNSEQEPECNSCHENSVGSTAEVSDQNFVDEDGGEKSYCAPMKKKLKRAAADTSINDQVVPFGKFQETDVSNVSRTVSERDEQNLLSEDPTSLTYQKADLHYFLRGS